MATNEPKRAAAPDPEALAGALRSLGMLYGARQPLAGGAEDESEAIRAWIRRERPHLLACYDLEELVALVRAARQRGADAGATLEQFGPA
jgi:hypothetical protein